MKLILSVSEITTLFKEIQKEPSKMFDLIRKDVKETIGNIYKPASYPSPVCL